MQYAKFKLGDLLDFELVRQAKSQKLIPDDNNKETRIPYIVQSTANNMFRRNVNRQYLVDHNEPIVSGNCIVLGVTLPAVSYQSDEFGGSQLIVGRAKQDWMNNKTGLYLVATIKVHMVEFSYNKKPGMKIYKNMDVLLPVTPAGDPDFAYMTKKIRELEAERIRELEAERIRELEAYLKVTGLDDTTLSGSEAAALTKKVIWKKFRIGGVFGKAQLGDTNLKKSDLTLTGDFVVTSGQTNNGILGRTTREAKIFPENTLTIDMFGYAYYRDFPYKMVTHGRVMSLSSDIIKNREVGLFLATVLSRLTDVFSYNNMATWKKLKNMSIMLPVTPNNQIDFTYMQNYIRAIEKQTIKNVVAYKDQVINETRKVVNE